MHGPFQIDPRDPRPLWRQIEEMIHHRVASGELAPGSQAPSVRDLARELVVNPATVAKAYRRLRAARVLEARRGEGTFVPVEPPPLPPAERRRRLADGARRFAALAASLRAGEGEAARHLREAYALFADGDREKP